MEMYSQIALIQVPATEVRYIIAHKNNLLWIKKDED